MSHDGQDGKLRDFLRLRPKIKFLSSIDGEECVEIQVIADLDNKEVEYLNTDVFVIKRAAKDDGNKIKASNLNTAKKGTLLRVEVPRDPVSLIVADDIVDLMAQAGCLEQEPKEFFLLNCTSTKTSYWSEDKSVPQEVQAYRAAVQLVRILKDTADGISPGSLQVTFFDVERIDILIKSPSKPMSASFPAAELRDFLSDEGLPETRKDAFRVTLWDKLKHFSPAERFDELLKEDRGSSFMRALRYNFRVAKKDFSLDRRLETARQEYRELAGNLAKLVSGLEAKAFVVPGTLLLSARFIDSGQGFGFKNATLCVSATILAIIVNVAYCTHQEISEEAADEIDRAKENLSEGEADQEVLAKLNRLQSRFNRVKKLKLGIVFLAWIVAAALVAACFLGGDPTKSENSTLPRPEVTTDDKLPRSSPEKSTKRIGQESGAEPNESGKAGFLGVCRTENPRQRCQTGFSFRHGSFVRQPRPQHSHASAP